MHESYSLRRRKQIFARSSPVYFWHSSPLVAARCALCHDLGRVVSVPRTRDEWVQITRNMIERGPHATADEVQTVAAYLSAHFGEETP